MRMSNALPASSGPDQADDGPELVKRVAVNRDRAAFQRLFVRFGPKVKSLMIMSGADTGMAEDLVQEVMLIVWRKAALYAPERGSVAAWVFTIARNLRIDKLRRQSARPYEEIDGLNWNQVTPVARTNCISGSAVTWSWLPWRSCRRTSGA